jgi:hypothetical protein
MSDQLQELLKEVVNSPNKEKKVTPEECDNFQQILNQINNMSQGDRVNSQKEVIKEITVQSYFEPGTHLFLDVILSANSEYFTIRQVHLDEGPFENWVTHFLE